MPKSQHKTTDKKGNDLSYFGMKEREIKCPHCHTKLLLASPMENIFVARRTCPKCKKEFVIENDEPQAA
jgi:ssDNA-binding Zn-finger/Zn-ribbon topoisomerase 1